MATTTVSPTPEPAAATPRPRGLPEWVRAHLLVGPAIVWLGALLLVPLGLVAVYSLGTRGLLEPVTMGTPRWSNYGDALQPSFFPIFLRTLLFAGTATLCCALLGFPLAWWIARHGGRRRSLLLGLVMVPFLTSFLVRMYAWRLILGESGPLHGLFDVSLLGTPFAVVLGLTYGYLPFMVFPLYTAIERMDHRLVEASYDLGEGRVATLWRVILPATAPGLVAGGLVTFIPASGDYVATTLLGSVRTSMFGQVVADLFGQGQNWPLGAAMAMILVAIMAVGVALYLRRAGEDAL